MLANGSILCYFNFQMEQLTLLPRFNVAWKCQKSILVVEIEGKYYGRIRHYQAEKEGEEKKITVVPFCSG